MTSIRQIAKFCVLVGAVSGTTAAYALTTNWNTNSNGLFTAPPNWNNGAPGIADTAVFDRGSDVTLAASFNGSSIGQPSPVTTIDRLIVRSNSVGLSRGTFGVNGPSLVANHNGFAGADSPIVVGQLAGDVGKLTTAIPITAKSATIAEAAGSIASVDIPSNTWTLNGSAQLLPTLIVGDGGFGTLSLSNGAQLHLTGSGERLIIGNQAGSGGGVLVSDAGTAIVMGTELTGFGNQLFVGFEGAGELSINAGGHVTDDGGVVTGAGQAFVDGAESLWFNQRGITIGEPPSTQTGQSQGSLIVSNGAVVQSYLGAEIYPSGTLGGNSEFICGDPGPHFLSTLQNDGTIAPGFATGTIIGRLEVFGNLKQSNTGHTKIQIAGQSGAQYDQLSLNGSAQLDGSLDVSLSNFVPQAGDEFNILDFNTTSGTFSSVNLPPLAAGLSWDTSQLYAKGIISVLGPHVVGDYNHNGIVDAADYVIWRSTLGSKSSLAADGNGNGVIDQGDDDVWRTHFGQTAGSGARVSTNAAVPEPATFVLLVLVSAVVSILRRRAA